MNNWAALRPFPFACLYIDRSPAVLLLFEFQGAEREEGGLGLNLCHESSAEPSLAMEMGKGKGIGRAYVYRESTVGLCCLLRKHWPFSCPGEMGFWFIITGRHLRELAAVESSLYRVSIT